jgi:hypothetical protein
MKELTPKKGLSITCGIKIAITIVALLLLGDLVAWTVKGILDSRIPD